MRKKQRSVVLASVILIVGLGCVVLLGQGTRAEEDVLVVAILHEKVDSFFKNLAGGGPTQITAVTPDEAFDALLVGSPLIDPRQRQSLVDRTSQFDDKYGRFISSERIAAKRVGQHVVVLKYLYKAENFPVVWTFTYYRNFKLLDRTVETENWIVIAVRFDTRLDLLGP